MWVSQLSAVVLNTELIVVNTTYIDYNVYVFYDIEITIYKWFAIGDYLSFFAIMFKKNVTVWITYVAELFEYLCPAGKTNTLVLT